MALTQVQGGMLQGSTNTTTTIQSNGTTAITIDSSQNVGVGSASSGNKFEVAGSGMFSGAVTTNTTGTHISYQSNNSQIGAWGPDTGTNGTLIFYSARSNGSNGLERMRIDSSGNLLIGTTSYSSSSNGFQFGGNSNSRMLCTNNVDYNMELFGSAGARIGFGASNSSSRVGSITVSTTNTSYNTSSDYRLKENIAPMTGALAKVQQLKPCTYTWKVDGSAGQGFIAHELQEVVPDAVTGEKDAVEEDGSIKSQQIDTSFLVATLTAAIQELNAKVEAQAAEIAAMKAAP